MTVTMVADTRKYYDDINFRISSADRAQWEQAILAAEATRLDDPAVMDILGAAKAKSPGDPAVLDMVARDVDSGACDLTPAAAEAEKWIDLALSLEEMQ